MAEAIEQTHTDDHAEGKEHASYLLIMGFLFIITLAEVILAEFVPRTPGTTLAALVLAGLVILSFAKIVLVAQYYMHLQSDSKWFTYIFLIPIPFMALISIILIVGGLLAGTGG